MAETTLARTRDKATHRHVSSSAAVLLVDDEPQVLKSLTRTLREGDFRLLTASSGKQALSILKDQPVAVVVSDQMMPGMDGVTFLEQAARLQPDTVRLMLTGHASFANAIDAINRSHIHRYLQKPWDEGELRQAVEAGLEHYRLVQENRRLQELTRRQNDQLRRLNAQLEQRVRQRTAQLQEAVNEGVLMLALAAEAKDDDTGDHVLRIRDISQAVALELGMEKRRAERIGFFSMMHDVGKIHIPDAILKKAGPLTAEQWEVMKTHTVAGERILGTQPFYAMARRIARSHHEKMDGTGYPDGLAGEQIPIEARIVAVADIYDALVNKRPYKPAWPREKALEEIQTLSGNHLDPQVVAAFFRFMQGNRQGGQR